MVPLSSSQVGGYRYKTRNEDLTFTFSLNCLASLEDRCQFHHRRSLLLLLVQPLSSLLVQQQQLMARLRAVSSNTNKWLD